ncbi:hypothetical protein ACHAPT_012476 [Fusarium lateritium]
MVHITSTCTLILATIATLVASAPTLEHTLKRGGRKVTVDKPSKPDGSPDRDPYGLDYTSKHLNKNEYHDRNLQWLRCERSHQEHEHRFTLGGSWMADGGKGLKKLLQDKKCDVYNYKHKFDNGKDFGDGMLQVSFNEPKCDMDNIIDAAVKLVEKNQKEFNQEETLLELYNCPGYGPDGRFITEEEAFAEMEMGEAEEEYNLAKALYEQRIGAAKNGGRIQFTQFSDVS